MATEQPSVLPPDRLNSADEQILDVLQKGRATPAYVSEQADLGRSYVSQRLIRLEEHGHVDELARGLYELVDDPRDEDESEYVGDRDPDELVAALEAERAETDRLADRVHELEADLEECRSAAAIDANAVADAVTALDRGLDRLPDDAPGRTPIEDARALLQREVDDAE